MCVIGDVKITRRENSRSSVEYSHFHRIRSSTVYSFGTHITPTVRYCVIFRVLNLP